jgi:hypothetical protein
VSLLYCSWLSVYRDLISVSMIWHFRLSFLLSQLHWLNLEKLVNSFIYRVGHEKVARLPFARVLVIFSLWHQYIALSDWTVSQQSCCQHFSPPPCTPPLAVLDCMLLALTHQSSQTLH